jgi:hypothetical protein
MQLVDTGNPNVPGTGSVYAQVAAAELRSGCVTPADLAEFWSRYQSVHARETRRRAKEDEAGHWREVVSV